MRLRSMWRRILDAVMSLSRVRRRTLPDLVAHGVKAWKIVEIESYIAHAKRQIDQVERRLLKGETIPQEEKLFSIFEPHTRWISKGKAWVSGGARGFRSASSRTGTASSCTTRSCGRAVTWIMPCRWSRLPRRGFPTSVG